MNHRRAGVFPISLLLIFAALATACTIPEQAPAASAGVSKPVFSLFDSDPQDLPPHLDSALADWGGILHEDAFFVTQGAGVMVWTAKSTDGVCIIYEYVERTNALAGAIGVTCGLDERHLAEAGGGLLYTSVGSRLVAVGVVVDGYEEAVTSGGSRYPVENNGFIVPLHRTDGGSADTSAQGFSEIEFESFVLIGEGQMLPSDALLPSDSDTFQPLSVPAMTGS